MLYLLDTNVLIDAHRDYYPVDRVPEFWDWLASMGEQARVKVPLEAYEEVIAGKEDPLTIWLKDNKINLMLDEQVDMEIVRRIVEEGYAADLTDDEIDKLGNDPFLAAYGLADGGHRVVVTTEVSKPSRTRANRHLPDVCRYFEISCVNTFQMVRALDFRTHWNAE